MNSTASTNASRAPRLLLALVLLSGLLGLGACAHSPTDQSIDDQADLQLTVQTFHRDMRWMRWEAAAMVVSPEKRDAFLARYDELGEDFHISNIEIKALEHHKTEVIVELEQESYMKPAMVVKKKRYIEVWKKPESDWFMTRRMLKDDYVKMKKLEAKRALLKGQKSGASAESDSAETPQVADDATTDPSTDDAESDDATTIE